MNFMDVKSFAELFTRVISIIIYRTDHVSAKINVDVIGKSLINSSSDIPRGSASILSILMAYEVAGVVIRPPGN